MSVLVESTLCSCSINILEVPARDWWGTGAGWTLGLTLHNHSELGAEMQHHFPSSHKCVAQKFHYCPAQITMWTRPGKYRYMMCAMNNLGSGRPKYIPSVLRESEGKSYSTFCLANNLFLEWIFAFGAVKSMFPERRTILKPLLINFFDFGGTQHLCFP